MSDQLETAYRDLIERYVMNGDETALDAAHALAWQMMRDMKDPEDLVAVHQAAVAGLEDGAALQRALAVLRAAMRVFGSDPLQALVRSSVATPFVAHILRDLEGEVNLSEVARMRVGIRYADNIQGDLQNCLEMYRLQGLGELQVAALDPARGTTEFIGAEMFESWSPSEYPQDHFTRGFLSRTVTRLTGRPMNCEEIECRAQGHSRCRFVVAPVTAGAITNLEQLLAAVPPQS